MSQPSFASHKRDTEHSGGQKNTSNTRTDPSPNLPPKKKFNPSGNMANKNPKLGVIRGQKTKYNPNWCPISLANEHQMKAIIAEGEQAIEIPSSEESGRSSNIVDAHLELNHILVSELTKAQ